MWGIQMCYDMGEVSNQVMDLKDLEITPTTHPLLIQMSHCYQDQRRTPSTLKSYFQQLMAYRAAHQFLYPSHPITRVAIVNIYGTDADDIKSNVTVLTLTQMEDYESQFFLRVSSGQCVGY